MNKIAEQLKILQLAIDKRKDLPLASLVEIVKKEAEANTAMVGDFYAANPVVSEFVSLLESRQNLTAEEYEKSAQAFYKKHEKFRAAAFQKEVLNSIRTSIPEGAHVAVNGGFAVMRSERRHGRSPSGTFPVNSSVIRNVEDFKHTGGSVTESEFLDIFGRMLDYLQGQKLYETNRFVGQGELAIPVRLVTNKPLAAIFSMNMFRESSGATGKTLEPWTIVAAPSFLHPQEDRFVDGVFKFTDYKRRLILIGGSGYNGEIKKAMFAVANHIYPLMGHLSLHCSSVFNGISGDVSLIFGLSGTGKSTVGSGTEGSSMLSDDETGINLHTRHTFNLENGNYYKTGGLLSEPRVMQALADLKPDQIALYENVVVAPSGNVVFAADPTANGRVSVPLAALKGAIEQGMYPLPKRIVILSRDVNAILDPICLLNKEQIVYYLNLGYTSKTPGTESGITKPVPTYSKWEGGPFYDLKDSIIMKILLEFLNENRVEGALLNSGEGGGPYGSIHNRRFPVSFTIELARSFMDGKISKHYLNHPEDFEENMLQKTIRPRKLPFLADEINASLVASKLWEKNGYKDEYFHEARALYEEFKAHAWESLTRTVQEVRRIVESGPK